MPQTKTVMAISMTLLILKIAPAQSIGPFVHNNYSFIEPVMPNFGIAQGSIFEVAGAPMSMTDTTASQGVPLQRSLAGVTVTVSVGKTVVQAIPYYVSPNQIDAVLPSSTPLGTATITVSSGVRSVTVQTTVVPRAFGLATLPAVVGPALLPWHAAVAQDDNEGGELLSQTNAANPGEYLTLWGSGLGAVAWDETQYQSQVDLIGVPIEVEIGGHVATVTYHGRSAFPGLDQINLIVPNGVSGCNVSVAVKAGGVSSNFATIPVATSGRMCSDEGITGISADSYQSLLARKSLNVGVISLIAQTTTGATGASGTSDSAYAAFQRYTAEQLAADSFLQMPSVGSCLVNQIGGWQAPLTGLTSPNQLKAGSAITVSGPSVSLILPILPNGSYREASLSTSFPVTGGAFAIDNGSGSSDVGGFKATITANVSAPIALTAPPAGATIDRSQSLRIAWNGGSPANFVYIVGTAPLLTGCPAAGGCIINPEFVCTALTGDGQFTVSPVALASLPASSVGSIYVFSGNIQPFTAPGLDVGLLFFGAGNGMPVRFN